MNDEEKKLNDQLLRQFEAEQNAKPVEPLSDEEARKLHEQFQYRDPNDPIEKISETDLFDGFRRQPSATVPGLICMIPQVGCNEEGLGGIDMCWTCGEPLGDVATAGGDRELRLGDIVVVIHRSCVARTVQKYQARQHEREVERRSRNLPPGATS